MFTLWPAYSTFQEERRGSISVGKQADLSVFDTDFLRAKPAAILTAKTVMTVVNGRVAYVADLSTDTPN
jgi:predicted amidohydrolase YtcJ